jgi:hypothetical protein
MFLSVTLESLQDSAWRAALATEDLLGGARSPKVKSGKSARCRRGRAKLPRCWRVTQRSVHGTVVARHQPMNTRQPRPAPAPKKPEPKQAPRQSRSQSEFEPDARTPDDRDGNAEHARVRHATGGKSPKPALHPQNPKAAAPRSR